MVFLADCIPPSELFEYSLKGIDICVKSGRFGISKYDYIIAAIKVFNKVVYAFLDNEINHVQQLYLLGLIVPNFVGDFEFEEHILVYHLNLRVKVAMIHTILGEVVDDIIHYCDETYHLHQQIHFLA